LPLLIDCSPQDSPEHAAWLVQSPNRLLKAFNRKPGGAAEAATDVPDGKSRILRIRHHKPGKRLTIPSED